MSNIAQIPQAAPQTDLASFDNSWYQPGGNILKRSLWYVTNILFFINPLNPFMGVKRMLLRAFGAKVGKGVIIKPSVNIKYPWLLQIGDHSWIGEHVWIDNLARIVIGNHVCISQGAMLLTGNHNYKQPSFDLMLGPIILKDGCWVGARSTVCPGVCLESHAVLGVGSIATKDLEAYSIYQGNPASFVRKRVISS